MDDLVSLPVEPEKIESTIPEPSPVSVPEPTLVPPPAPPVIPSPVSVPPPPPIEIPAPVLPPVEEKKGSMLFYILALILIVAGLAFSAYTFVKNKTSQNQVAVTPTSIPKPTESVPTPTPDPTASWKIYTNTEFKFSLRYPIDITFIEGGNKNHGCFVNETTKGVEGFAFQICFDILNNPSKLEAKSYVDKIISDKNTSSGGKMISISEQLEIMKSIQRNSITIDGASSEKIIGLPAISETIEVYVPSKDKIIHIWMELSGKNDLEGEKETKMRIFDQILSTFKFLE